MHYLLTDILAEFEINWPIKYLITAKMKAIGSFFSKKEKLLKMNISDMHHRITYMFINFQQNRVSRAVKTVHTNIFAK